MPSSTSGLGNKNPVAYSNGSGGININPPEQDDPFIDPHDELRWKIFRADNTDMPLDECRHAFNLMRTT